MRMSYLAVSRGGLEELMGEKRHLPDLCVQTTAPLLPVSQQLAHGFSMSLSHVTGWGEYKIRGRGPSSASHVASWSGLALIILPHSVSLEGELRHAE